MKSGPWIMMGIYLLIIAVLWATNPEGLPENSTPRLIHLCCFIFLVAVSATFFTIGLSLK
jgi:hypothetical protein